MQASGLVLPEGTVPPIATLPAGKHDIDIVLVNMVEIPEMKLQFPDGFMKFYQEKSIIDLLGKISGILKARYGVTEYKILSAPTEIAVGKIEIEV